jgi:hypothetical protein
MCVQSLVHYKSLLFLWSKPTHYIYSEICLFLHTYCSGLDPVVPQHELQVTARGAVTE